jgi:hypothetical protein
MASGSKVFSVTDFKEGLDVRKTPLTAPGGSLRILENAVINNGGEIEKRLAFVKLATTASDDVMYLFGQGAGLHLFYMVEAPVTITDLGLPVPITPHPLPTPPGDPITFLADVEPFGSKFFVCGWGTSGLTYCWYDGVLVLEADGSYSHGSYARTWKSKMYRIDGPYLRFSGVNNPAQNDPASVTEPGAGFINMALNDPDAENLLSMEIYYNQMAVMARVQSQLWTLDPDPTNDTLSQLLRIGVVAPRSMVQFGTGDVLFLSDSGVRSLKALYVNLAASVSDVGSAIDPLLIEAIRAEEATGIRGILSRMDAVVQPIQGRYWLSSGAVGDTIYVLSYFPAGNITAWSTFAPGFMVKNFALVEQKLFCMSEAGDIYLYGGVTGIEYEDCLVTVRTPHMHADSPTENKRIKSVDVMCQGQWAINIGMLPNNTEAFELVATVQDNTYGLMSIPFAGYGTHFGLHMTHQAPGPATLSAVHLNLLEGVVK